MRNLFSSFNYFAYNKSQVTINGIKTDYIEKNAKKSFSDKECDYCFMNNNKYHYIAVINPNALLATFSSKHDVDIFFFSNRWKTWPTYRDHDHVELEIPKKIEIIFNKEINEMEEVAGNILKHSIQNVQVFTTTFYQHFWLWDNDCINQNWEN